MAESTQSQPIKLTLTHYRKPEHTHEAFIKWIVEGHLPLAIPVLKKHDVINYTLFVTPPPMNDALKQELGPIRPGWEFADYDCIIEYIFPGMETINNLLSDPEWHATLKDQDNWVDVPKATVSLGHRTVYMENGEPTSVVE